jgi:hypothetical protein
LSGKQSTSTLNITAKQQRLFKLIIALRWGTPASSALKDELQCSIPTLHRLIKEIRESYNSDIVFHHGSKRYEMKHPGSLTPQLLNQIEKLVQSLKTEPQIASNKLKSNSLKQNISVSLHQSRLKVLNDLTEQTAGMNRSDHIESALDLYFKNLKIDY